MTVAGLTSVVHVPVIPSTLSVIPGTLSVIPGLRAGNLFHRAAGQVGLQGVPVAFHQAFGQVELADHRRKDVAAFQIEIVAGAIQVRRHHGNIVAPVLDGETLAHLEAGDLGDGVWLVGILERRHKQGILPHRLRRLLGIDAGRAEEQEFLDPVLPALADDVLLDLQVLVDEVGAVFQVGHNAPDVRGGKDDGVRALGIEEGLHRSRVFQVKLRVRAADEIGEAPLYEVVPNRRAHKSAVPGDIDLRILIQHSPNRT